MLAFPQQVGTGIIFSLNLQNIYLSVLQAQWSICTWGAFLLQSQPALSHRSLHRKKWRFSLGRLKMHLGLRCLIIQTVHHTSTTKEKNGFRLFVSSYIHKYEKLKAWSHRHLTMPSSSAVSSLKFEHFLSKHIVIAWWKITSALYKWKWLNWLRF